MVLDVQDFLVLLSLRIEFQVVELFDTDTCAFLVELTLDLLIYQWSSVNLLLLDKRLQRFSGVVDSDFIYLCDLVIS